MNHLFEDKSNLDKLHIIIGDYCNELCSHCCQNAHVAILTEPNKSEMDKIIRAIWELDPIEVSFTGGEPTFFWPQMMEIIKSTQKRDRAFSITTNGYWAASIQLLEQWKEYLTSLKSIKLSYNPSTGQKLKPAYIKRLKSFCEYYSIELNLLRIVFNWSDVAELPLISQLTGLPVIFQTIRPVGRGSQFSSFRYPIFNYEVLEKKCPHLNHLTYEINRGFTFCCSQLKDSPFLQESLYFETWEECLSSPLRSQLQQYSFAELAKNWSIVLDNVPESCSEACGMCEWLILQKLQHTEMKELGNGFFV